MTVFVTGGAGFIGSHTCVELLEAGYQVVIADNFSNSNPEVLNRIRKITGKDFRFYETDIRDSAQMDRIFTENAIDAVIHFAGLKAVGESVHFPLKYYRHNLDSTFVLCDVMQKHGVGILVFSSSATVYGDTAASPVREDSPVISAACPYGETKLMQERILKDICDAGGLSSVSILRYFNPVGAHPSGLIGEDPNGIPANLLPYVSMVSIGKLPYLTVYGNDYDTADGTGIRDYIHVTDLAKAHLKALERAKCVTGVEYFNLGTGNGYSVLEVIHAYEKVTGSNVPYQIGPRREGDIPVSFCDPSKARKELGWKAECDIERMCEDLFRWQTMNPNGYAK